MRRTTKITTKGQVVIPKHFRDMDDLHVGDSVSIVSDGTDICIAKRSGWARATAGSLSTPMPPLESDALDELADRVAIQEAHEEYKGVE